MVTQSLNCTRTSGRKNELILPPLSSSQESQRTAQGSMENGEAAIAVTLRLAGKNTSSDGLDRE